MTIYDPKFTTIFLLRKKTLIIVFYFNSIGQGFPNLMSLWTTSDFE